MKLVKFASGRIDLIVSLLGQKVEKDIEIIKKSL